MSDKILFVDDEPLVLDGYMRMLFREFKVDTAVGGEQALATIKASGPYAVVISDMCMPGLNGAQFLAKLRQKSPDTVRMLLTGYTDIDAAIEAVNEGNILRYLTKPCEKEALVSAIKFGLEKYRSAKTERKLLEKARVIERATAEPDTASICLWDNGESPTGLPGPSQAKSLLAPLFGADPRCYVVMLRITMLPMIEQRYGEEAGRDYLNLAAQTMVQGFRSEDRFFHWGRDVLMVVVRRQFSASALRMEVARVTSADQEHVLTVNGKSIITTCPIAFDLLPVAQCSTLDDMLMAFDSRATQSMSIGRV
ncbi:MAG: response regulator [Terracidiphilus sp.]|nr:response regulator [Terracidiphilus sp.]